MLNKTNTKQGESMSTVKLNKKVLSYKDYVVFKTEDNCFEVWDYTFKTPTTWLCGIVETLEETKPLIEECIINNKIAREERI